MDRAKIVIMIGRGDYVQCGFLIRKGAFSDIQSAGLPAFRAELAELAPFITDRLDQIRDLSDVRLLTVVVDRLRRWYRSRLLCIGDAAHAMSPIGRGGIHLAIQDATPAAN